MRWIFTAGTEKRLVRMTCAHSDAFAAHTYTYSAYDKKKPSLYANRAKYNVIYMADNSGRTIVVYFNKSTVVKLYDNASYHIFYLIYRYVYILALLVELFADNVS